MHPIVPLSWEARTETTTSALLRKIQFSALGPGLWMPTGCTWGRALISLPGPGVSPVCVTHRDIFLQDVDFHQLASKENDPDLLQPSDLPDSSVVCCLTSFPKQSYSVPTAPPSTCWAYRRAASCKKISNNFQAQHLQKTKLSSSEISSQCGGRLRKLQNTPSFKYEDFGGV